MRHQSRDFGPSSQARRRQKETSANVLRILVLAKAAASTCFALILDSDFVAW